MCRNLKGINEHFGDIISEVAEARLFLGLRGY
ncbi:MAG: hypothetical protein ACI8TF_000887 [Paracoccaceae bacterium]|jgi:hypothetical protein